MAPRHANLTVRESGAGACGTPAIHRMSPRCAALALLLAALVANTVADSLVITKDGNAIWVTGTRTDGDNLRYTTGTNREERVLAQSTVAVVVPGVEKGRTYTTQDVESATNLIRQVEKRFPRLYRQTNVLKQEWGTVSNPDSGADERIDEILAAFDSKGRSPAAYKESCYRMEMIRFRDKQGRLTARLDAAADRLRGDFFRAAQTELAALVSATPPSVTNFARARNFAETILSCPVTPAQKELVNEQVRKHLRSTINSLLTPALAGIASARSIDPYLAGRSTLTEIQRLAGGSTEAQTAVAQWQTRLVDAATNALPGYDLSLNGFPLSEEDRQIIAAAGGMSVACATGAVHGMALDPQCMLLVTQALPNVTAGDRIPLPLRIIFGYLQPKDRRFALAGVLKAANPTPSPSVWRLPALTIREGHADITVSLSAPPRQTAQPPGTPPVFHLFLVYEDPSPGALSPSWTAASKAFAIPIR